MKNDKDTYKDLYGLVDRKISEVNASIQRLENKFDVLEQGRLSRIERDFANLQGKMTVIAAVVSIVISGVFLIFDIFFKK